MFARIAACVDGGPAGKHACSVATEMAARFHCALTLLTVLRSGEGESQTDLERLVPMDAESRSIHRFLEDARQAATERGIPKVEIVYLRGSVVDAILEYLRATPPDLVVVGTRGLSRRSRVLLGSVSSRLVSDAPCPVLVVRNVARRERHRSP